MWGNDFNSSFLAFLKIYITKKRKFHQFQNNYYKVWPKFIKKCDRYDKVKQSLLQSVTGIANCDIRLLQSAIGITKCDSQRVF